jgi:predicted RNA-binding Zn-ribbon protein involved in translation (DUF1610 family)
MENITDELIQRAVDRLKTGLAIGSPALVMIPTLGSLIDLFWQKWPAEMSKDQAYRTTRALRALNNQCTTCGNELQAGDDLVIHCCKKCSSEIAAEAKKNLP